MSTSILIALPGKLDIKSYSPSILYISADHTGKELKSGTLTLPASDYFCHLQTVWTQIWSAKRWAWSGSELFDTLMEFLKEVLEKFIK